jgi:hypothetical protein
MISGEIDVDLVRCGVDGFSGDWRSTVSLLSVFWLWLITEAAITPPATVAPTGGKFGVGERDPIGVYTRFDCSGLVVRTGEMFVTTAATGTGGRTGVTSGETTRETTGVTAADTTGLTSGDTTGVTSSGTTCATTGETTGVTASSCIGLGDCVGFTGFALATGAITTIPGTTSSS